MLGLVVALAATLLLPLSVAVAGEAEAEAAALRVTRALGGVRLEVRPFFLLTTPRRLLPIGGDGGALYLGTKSSTTSDIAFFLVLFGSSFAFSSSSSYAWLSPSSSISPRLSVLSTSCRAG